MSCHASLYENIPKRDKTSEKKDNRCSFLICAGEEIKLINNEIKSTTFARDGHKFATEYYEDKKLIKYHENLLKTYEDKLTLFKEKKEALQDKINDHGCDDTCAILTDGAKGTV